MPLNMAATRAANAVPVRRPPRAPSRRRPSGARCSTSSSARWTSTCSVWSCTWTGSYLNITAVPGAGALLGNLLCAVVGLLDGTGIGGLGGILTNLLNAILGILQA